MLAGKDKICVIGNGMVIDPKALVEELAYLHERNVDTSNLRISNRAQWGRYDSRPKPAEGRAGPLC